MEDFQKENATRMAVYCENTKKIADYLFVKFYKVDQFDSYYDPSIELMDQEKCKDKASRLYQFFKSAEEVKRMMDFVNTVNPGLAKDLVDGL